MRFEANALKRLVAIVALLVCASSPAVEPDVRALYHARLDPHSPTVRVEIRVEQTRRRLVELDFSMPEVRYAVVDTAAVRRKRDRVVWKVDRSGASLAYDVALDHERADGEHDAKLTDRFAVFRGTDLFPPVKVRAKRSARPETSLTFTVPVGWSVETPYGRFENGDAPLIVGNAERRFDRPVGWMIAGDIGVRREKIAGIWVVVAAPRGSGLRRNDVIAFMRWNLGGLFEIVPMTQRLLIVGVGDGFWRGGLSAPNSLYLHAGRPLISENGTSTLMHELFHVATRLRAAGDDDWIVEGLAEYYSVELMRRSSTVSQRRFRSAIRALDAWGTEATTLKAEHADGPIRAKAAVYFNDLARKLSAQGASLDDVVRELSQLREVRERDLKRIVAKVMKSTR